MNDDNNELLTAAFLLVAITLGTYMMMTFIYLSTSRLMLAPWGRSNDLC
ncbi:hypothetical protein [Marinomonas sp. FW-1]|nr:hypothetical protein [Marinomonas sp. FW-1]